MGCSSSHDIKSAKSMSTEFMILFESDDFEERIFFDNKVEKAQKVSSKLPGRFAAYDITKLDELNIRIKGMPVIHALYIKLPKENIFVTSDTWEEDFFSAQILETMHIWTQLGAKEIKFDSQRSLDNSHAIMADIGIGSPGTKFSVGGSYENRKSEEGKFSGNVVLDHPKKINYVDLDNFIDKNNIYYSRFAPRWLNIIEYKLDNQNLYHIDFQYTFTKGIHCSAKVFAKFNDIGISFGLSSDRTQSTYVCYDVDFEAEIEHNKECNHAENKE